MYIDVVKNRTSPPAALLRESYREGGKVKKVTLANLSCLPGEVVEGLRVLLKGGTAGPPDQEAVVIERSLPHGHVAAVFGTLRAIGLDRILGPAGLDWITALRAPAARSPAAQSRVTTGVSDVATPVHSFPSLLADLATITRNTARTVLAPKHRFTLTTRPTPIQRLAFDLLAVPADCTR